jgi:hypothetical protein
MDAKIDDIKMNIFQFERKEFRNNITNLTWVKSISNLTVCEYLKMVFPKRLGNCKCDNIIHSPTPAPTSQ